MKEHRSTKNTFQKAINCFKFLDITATNPQLNINQSRRHKTTLGSCITLAFLGILITSAVIFSQDMITKSIPASVVRSEQINDVHELQVGKDTFNMGFVMSLLFSNQQVMDPTLYHIQTQMLITGTWDHNGNLISDLQVLPLEMEPCKNDSFQNEFRVQGYCFKENQKNIPKALPDVNGTLLVVFQKCSNATSHITNVTCKPQEVIDEFFENSFFLAFFTDNVINNDSYDKPITAQQGLYGVPYNDFGRLSWFQIQRVEYITDSGWFSKEIQNITSAVMASTDQDTGRVKAIPGECYFRIQLQNKKVVFQRSYKKIQDVMAEIVGLFNGIFFFVVFILRPYLLRSYYINLAKNLFKVNKKSKNGKKTKKLPTFQDQYTSAKSFETIESVRKKADLQQSQFSQLESPDKLQFRRIYQSDNENITSINNLESLKMMKGSLSNLGNTEQDEENPNLTHNWNSYFHEGGDQHTSPKIYKSLGTLKSNFQLQNLATASEENPNAQNQVSQNYQYNTQGTQVRHNKKAENNNDNYEPSTPIDTETQFQTEFGAFSQKNPKEIREKKEVKFRAKPQQLNLDNPKNITTDQNFTRKSQRKLSSMAKERRMLGQAKFMVKRQCDIAYIMKKMIQFERFKNLILNQDQQILFDNLPEITIFSRDHETSTSIPRISDQLFQSFEGMRKLTVETRQKIRRQQNKSSIDWVLLEAFEQEGQF